MNASAYRAEIGESLIQDATELKENFRLVS